MARRQSISKTPKRELESSFSRIQSDTFSGFVFDMSELARRYTIDLLVDGQLLKTASANEFVYELALRKIGDGCYGFSFFLPKDAINAAQVVEARLSNIGTQIGTPVILTSIPLSRVDEPGVTHWLGGLRFSGWIDTSGREAPILDVLIDGVEVDRIKALGWAHANNGSETGRAVRAFDFHLPERFADGCVHYLTLLKDNGEKLRHPSMPFVAFADGLAQTIGKLGGIDSERLRGELFDRLLPISVPISHYEDWRARFPITSPGAVAIKCGIVLVGPGSIQKTLSSLENQTHHDWVAVSLTASVQQSQFDPEEVIAFLAGDGRDCDVIVFAMSGTVFEENAIARVVSVFDEQKDVISVYGDIDMLLPDGGRWPLSFPSFDYERNLEQGYCAHLFAMRRIIARNAVTLGAANLYRVFNMSFDVDLANIGLISHLPGALAIVPAIDVVASSTTLRDATLNHLNTRGVQANVNVGKGQLLPAVRVTRLAPSVSVTIIIPTRNRVQLLQKCLATIRPAIEKSFARVIVVDNDSSEPDTLAYFAEIASATCQILHVKGPFNFARLNNLAAQAAKSEFICLLNNDVEAMDEDWLEEMLGRLSDPNVGAVGAMLLWPSGVIQHGGVVLGASFAAHHAFNDRVDGDPGPGDLLQVAHECSAVTAACLLTRRKDYLGVGGMDENQFSVAFNDVDYCLKLRAIGKRIVFTPHARLWHLESASRGRDDKPDRKSRFHRELQMLRAKWNKALLEDPYYSPVLSLDPIPYSALAWPPRSLKPRSQTVPNPVDLPPGL